MKKNIKWFVTLLVLMVVSSHSYAQEGISWLRQAYVRIRSIDGKRVNSKYPMIVTPGTRSIIVNGLPRTPLTLDFEPNRYYGQKFVPVTVIEGV